MHNPESTAGPRCVHLHVGLPKTGTTSIQEILWQNRAEAAESGLLYPGDAQSAQFDAAVDVQRRRYAEWFRPEMGGAWDRLVARMRDWPGTAVVSSELFATATSREVAAIMADLAFAEVHLVVTVRDLARQIPSAWQENIKTRQTMSFPDYLTALRTDDTHWISGMFWDGQDAPRVLRTWGESLPPGRVHVVTVPPRGSSDNLVWRRFASVLGPGYDRLTNRAPRYNYSLSLADTELVRRLNVELGDDLEWPRYSALVKELLATDILPHRRERPTHIPLPKSEYGWVRERAERIVTEIRGAGFDVVGDLDDLLPSEPSSHVVDADDSDGHLLDVAVHALAELVRNVPPPPVDETGRAKYPVRRPRRHPVARVASLGRRIASRARTPSWR